VGSPVGLKSRLFVIGNKSFSEMVDDQGITGVQGVHTQYQHGDYEQESGLRGEVGQE
jgi:hypothetical protein